MCVHAHLHTHSPPAPPPPSRQHRSCFGILDTEYGKLMDAILTPNVSAWPMFNHLQNHVCSEGGKSRVQQADKGNPDTHGESK